MPHQSGVSRLSQISSEAAQQRGRVLQRSPRPPPCAPTPTRAHAQISFDGRFLLGKPFPARQHMASCFAPAGAQPREKFHDQVYPSHARDTLPSTEHHRSRDFAPSCFSSSKEPTQIDRLALQASFRLHKRSGTGATLPIAMCHIPTQPPWVRLSQPRHTLDIACAWRAPPCARRKNIRQPPAAGRRKHESFIGSVGGLSAVVTTRVQYEDHPLRAPMSSTSACRQPRRFAGYFSYARKVGRAQRAGRYPKWVAAIGRTHGGWVEDVPHAIGSVAPCAADGGRNRGLRARRSIWESVLRARKTARGESARSMSRSTAAYREHVTGNLVVEFLEG